MKQNKIEILNYLFIAIGAFVLAFGVTGFLIPNHIATGGVTGFAIVLHNVVNLPVALLIGFINVPALILGLKYLGRKFAFKTIFCIFSVVVFVDTLTKVVQLPNLSDNLMLATLYGGVIIGVGLGLVFKGGGAAGGGSIIASIISSRTSIKSSTVVLVIDGLVVISAGVVFKSIELALWSMISIYASSKLIDVVLLGAKSQKIVHIASLKNLEDLSKIIHEKMGLAGTIVRGNDLNIQEYKHIIFIMVDKNQLSTLKQLVLSYDENVRMIVSEASEVLGKTR